MINKPPYAMVYNNGYRSSIYTTFGDLQYIFYWDQRLNAQHRYPQIREYQEIKPDWYTKHLDENGCILHIDGQDIEFQWNHNKKLSNPEIIFHGHLANYESPQKAKTWAQQRNEQKYTQ
jgi:hypothetical protein